MKAMQEAEAARLSAARAMQEAEQAKKAAIKAQQEAKKQQAGYSCGAANTGPNVAAMSEEEQVAYAMGMSMAESEPAVLQVIRGNVHMK